jgi:hypothetical protein
MAGGMTADAHLRAYENVQDAEGYLRQERQTRRGLQEDPIALATAHALLAIEARLEEIAEEIRRVAAQL